MPFDALPSPDTASPITAKPSLEALAWALEHLREVRPEWRWSFSQHSTCAIGVAASLWQLGGSLSAETLGDLLGMRYKDAYRIFISGRWRFFLFPPSPRSIARDLRAHIARRT
jgi:hypothetical protein